jgi:tRNA pseudouridine55 synthase
MNPNNGGILLLNKSRGKTSFSLVYTLRKLTGIQRIGHAGTLDPFATGVMVLLLGKDYTRLSSRFMGQEKEYLAKIKLGIATDTFDCDGKILNNSDKVPTPQEIEIALKNFQGTISQLPPMFSAKKINGKKLYELARQGKEIEREPIQVTLETELLFYQYPYLELRIACTKGTYIRSLAHDLGNLLGSFGHLQELVRMRSGQFHLKDCIDQTSLLEPNFDIQKSLLNFAHIT